jgi:hypothetical protein
MGFPKRTAFPTVYMKGQPQSIGGAFMAANVIIYSPFSVLARQRFTRLRWKSNTNVSGSFDAGIYDSTFAALYRKGSTALVGGNVQYDDAIDLTLEGQYYFAWVFTLGGVNQNWFISGQQSNTAGARRETGVFPLPLQGTPIVIANGLDTGNGCATPLFTLV